MIILPQLSMICSPISNGGFSAPSNKYGWLQHFLNCITIFNNPILLADTDLETLERSLCKILLYQSTCISVG
ncbi:hypothetical protein A0H76_1617 [Hepatospora eriocheir]|uniref:Uncharacterized protein n=1 Tax=Hepatospora eriocheir TaxID=1081669 RepID=A0A1X0Q5P8_9MICR|nr:hypothetical protein A0H76_1617 [Hepatospora eriocheir]